MLEVVAFALKKSATDTIVAAQIARLTVRFGETWEFLEAAGDHETTHISGEDTSPPSTRVSASSECGAPTPTGGEDANVSEAPPAVD